MLLLFFLTFTISSFAGNDDSYWRKCELDFSDPLKSLSGSVFRFDHTGDGNHYSYALNTETLKGSGYNPTYQFNSFYWQPFRGIDFMGGDSTIKIEFVLQYKDFADAFLQGYNQCRRIETYTAFYVSGQTLYNYTVNLVNGAQTIPLYFEAVKTAAYEPTPVNYWCDFELDPSAYFSISFDVGLTSLSPHLICISMSMISVILCGLKNQVLRSRLRTSSLLIMQNLWLKILINLTSQNPM